ncbi:MAG TPA: hypothetical protein VGR21_11225, partial [Cryptosporangiaceae bacterium]|nr:hypothetical protein [Cryptosporangiaceae bacterium]
MALRSTGRVHRAHFRWTCAAGFTLALAWVVVAMVVTPATAATSSTVLVAKVDGPITPVTAEHLVDGVAKASRDGHEAMQVELDTPGGLDTSMRRIVKAFLAAETPVVVYVAPSGARAASAGAIITFSAHVAAMAPGTTIGAATPVNAETGEKASDKVINDAAAFAESVADQRGRDTAFAVATVREGRAVTAQEAHRIGAVDLLAANRTALLDAIDGRVVTLAGGQQVTLETAGARTVDHDMGFFRELLQLIADPNLAFLFLSIGTLAVIYELASPGMGLGGVTGAILLILGFFALSVLPVNVAGIGLLVLAGALFAAEVLTPGVGVFATGGTIALVVSGLFLFEGDTVEVDLAVLLPTALVVGAGAVLAGRLAWRARNRPPVSGAEALLGATTV